MAIPQEPDSQVALARVLEVVQEHPLRVTVLVLELGDVQVVVPTFLPTFFPEVNGSIYMDDNTQ